MRTRDSRGQYVIEPWKQRFEDSILRVPFSGCWLWMGAMKKRGDSYGVFGLNGKNISAHRASYLLFRGPIPEGLHVLHRCDVRCCVNPHHLWLGTNLENVRDRDQKGRRAPMFGANHPQHKLIESEVVDILASSLTAREAADAYGVCVSNIYYIRSKKTWRHVRLDFDAKHGQCGAVA